MLIKSKTENEIGLDRDQLMQLANGDQDDFE